MYEIANDERSEFCCFAMKKRIDEYDTEKPQEGKGWVHRIGGISGYSIVYDRPYRKYNILMFNNDDCLDSIFYCPWCGKKLPEWLNPWDTIKKEYGEDYVKYRGDPGYKELPPELMKEFETDEWWKKRNIGPDDPGF